MKESVIITNFKMAEKQRIQNNQMIGALVDDTRQMQEMLAGFLNVIRRLPGYTEAIAELAKEHEEAEAKAAEAEAEAEAAKNIEVVDAEEVKPTLHLGKDND